MACMTLSIALALIGAATGFAAALVLVVRYSQGANHQSRLALAQTASARLRDLEQRAHGGALGAASAEQARIALLNELLAADWQSQWWPLRGDRGALVAIGLAALATGCFSVLPFASEGPSAAGNISMAAAAPQDPDLARLELYVRSRAPSSATASAIGSPTQKELPDVGTMIERLAARLRSQPEDAEGWRMLGWSYLHTEQAAKAVEAFGRAVAQRESGRHVQSGSVTRCAGCEG
jgi:cytochrome c-type biogenesis protein CcmH